MAESSLGNMRQFIKKLSPETSFITRKMVLFSQPKKCGEVKVYIEVIKYQNAGSGAYRKKTIRIPTEIWILPKHWSKKKQEVLSKDEKHRVKNAFIEELHIKIKDYLNNRDISKFEFKTPYEIAMNVDKIRVNLKKLQELFPPVEGPKAKDVIAYFEQYIQFRRDRKTPRGTLKEFITVKNRLKKFDVYRHKNSLLHEIDIAWSDQFEAFLLNHIENRDRKGYNLGTVEKTYTVLITVLYHFYERRKQMKIIMTDDFTNKGFKRGKKSKNEANPLSQQQFKVLFTHKFEKKHLEQSKKRFCIQCTTGLRYGDISRIRPKMVKNGVLTIVPKKSLHLENPKKAIIPLNKFAVILLDEFGTDTSSLHIQNQPYNRNLIEIFKIMREKYPDLEFGEYSSHDGRDTFISLAVEKRVDFKTILEWTAQSSYNIMDRYIKTSEKHKIQLMNETWDF